MDPDWNSEKQPDGLEPSQEYTDQDNIPDRYIDKPAPHKSSRFEKILVALLIATLFLTIFNTYQISQLTGASGISVFGNAFAGSSGTRLDSSCTSPGGHDSSAAGSSAPASGSGLQRGAVSYAGLDVLPAGVPDIYGKELGVSFDDVSSGNKQKADATIKKLGLLDQKINLTNDELKRYIAVAGQISCEYCCTAKSIIFSNGQAACGCAHSYAMRGVAKYLIKYHGNEYTDNQVLEELGKWKTLFFPGQITEKARMLQEKGVELSYTNLTSNRYRGVEKGVSGEMVGKC